MLSRTFLLLVMIMNVGLESQKYVMVEAKPPTVGVENGKTFFLQVKFKPANGIHVNVQPPVTVRSLDDEIIANVKEMPASGEYLDFTKPVEIECKMTKGRIGEHRLNLVIDYTYCSDKEKWCRMGRDTVSVKVRVKK